MTQNTTDIHAEVRRTVYAAMETGQFDQAYTLLVEYTAQYKSHAEALRLQLVRDYGVEV